MSNQKIDDLLTSDQQRFSTLQRLIRQSDAQAAATSEVRALLPEPMQKACRVLDSTPPRLVLACRSSAVATRLRFLAPDLLKTLKSLPQYAAVEEISVRVVET